ncbi:MAG: class I SAM-dependent methyltransferase [Candidatus Sulfotelmatobacter sp.]|jgi:SAM-dependent methyltransferase
MTTTIKDLPARRAFPMDVKALAKRVLPRFRSRLAARRLLYFPLDTLEYALHLREPITPPRGLWFVGGEKNYRAINEEFLRYFVELGGLKSDHHVLDIGCGVGVMASRLTSFLSPAGAYDGFDIVKPGITWCQKHISSRLPNFTFAYADVYHEQYNPKGKLAISSWNFPYPDEAFDFAWLKSVFTHMTPAPIQHYLRQIRRVLRPGGTCLATLFFLNEESTQLIAQGKSSLPIIHCQGDHSVADLALPELAVGIPQDLFHAWCEHAGLQVDGPIRYGSWCGRIAYTSYQDLVVLRKPR